MGVVSKHRSACTKKPPDSSVVSTENIDDHPPPPAGCRCHISIAQLRHERRARAQSNNLFPRRRYRVVPRRKMLGTPTARAAAAGCRCHVSAQ
ncbi:hypothetical protein TNIN_227371 [Trichonephila inaurata madagascariensis]|uniref:Uncharacterized protein n=1 Tax=Trichonephila inaurata madagascariensis TaxID=2747483 RepID=A0A8X6JD28_9ARAC|nr:hypothetical protein TNIN_227371 [Trichonephila inaurata madagascariensis]